MTEFISLFIDNFQVTLLTGIIVGAVVWSVSDLLKLWYKYKGWDQP
jgi:hypothetical protein